jgi:hypothetical protein
MHADSRRCRLVQPECQLQHELREERSLMVGQTLQVDEAALAEEVRRTAFWLGVGSLIPVIGWLHGVGKLWNSPAFRRREQVIGTLLFPFGWFGAMAVTWWSIVSTAGYCYETEFGERDGRVIETAAGCEQMGALSPGVGMAVAAVALVAAAAGPLYVRVRASARLRSA